MTVLQELQARQVAAQEAATFDSRAREMTDAAALLTGRLWYVGSGRLSLSVAGNVRALITNPAGSGRRLLIERLIGLATSTVFADLRRNPTTGLPVGTRTPVNARPTAPVAPSVAVVAVDISPTTALGGGTSTGIVIGVPGGSRLDWPFVFDLDPGESLGFNMPFAGATDASFTVKLKERPL